MSYLWVIGNYNGEDRSQRCFMVNSMNICGEFKVMVMVNSVVDKGLTVNRSTLVVTYIYNGLLVCLRWLVNIFMKS